MDYSLETVEEKLIHLKMHLWDLQREQDVKGNAAMAYVLEHLNMIADNARMQYLEETEDKEDGKKEEEVEINQNNKEISQNLQTV